MPPANKAIEKGSLLRTFIYGADKTKKTWWSFLAAEAGYNVVFLNCDAGEQIISQISEEARERIQIIDIVDEKDRPVAAKFMGMFLRDNNSFIWDEVDKAFVLKPNPEHSHYVVDSAKLDKNTVVVLDSWTALVASTMFSFASENSIDLSSAAKQEWDGYGYQGRFLDFVLRKFKSIGCHVIVIGHEGVFEKRSKDGKTIISSKTVPISSSNPHSLRIGLNFNDVLRFLQISSTVYKIEASGSSDAVGGSRALAPQTYDWKSCPPKLLLDNIGAKPDNPLPPCEGFRWYDVGEEPEIKKPNFGKHSADAANASKISAGVTTTAETQEKKPAASIFAKKS